jgi:pimeloyl-ACP methyl ester carboxylesterase
MSERVEIRVYENGDRPTLIYLPGLHGDWTLIGGFRPAVKVHTRFVETTYPRTLTWSLADYAAGVEAALARAGIRRGWLLGESFGSQVVWPMLQRQVFDVQGIILAGGFVRHPALWAVRMAERICGGAPLSIITAVLFGYAKVARLRFRRSPETLAGIEEFIARRTELDRQAAKHRLRILAGSDPRPTARGSRAPVYGLTGVLDPIVPWPWVRSWMKNNCPSLRDYRVVWGADHNVLGTAPRTAAEQVIQWMREKEHK